jgi:hypothetical protein
MAKHKAEATDAHYAQQLLHAVYGLDHLRARHDADLVMLESGPTAAPKPHARLRRVGPKMWRVELPLGHDAWEQTDLQANLDLALTFLAKDFAEALTLSDDA